MHAVLRSFVPASVVAVVLAAPAVNAADSASPDRPSTEHTESTTEARRGERDDEDAVKDTAIERASLEVAGYQDSDHVTVVTPSVAVGVENVSGASLQANYLVDVVSAASVDIVSTASSRWQEVRHGAGVSGDYKPHDLGVGVGGSVSSEPDYLSYGGYGRITQDFNEKNWTAFFGFGVSRDMVGRCGGNSGVCTPFSVFSREVLRDSFNGGVNVIIDPSSLGSLSLDVIVENGDQSKPYRYIPMFSPSVAPLVPKGASINWVNNNRLAERPLEQLPLSRERFALTARYARRLGSTTVRLMERGYYDTWGLFAASTDVRLIWDLGRRFQLGPHTRFHVQRPVTFWRRAYVSGTGWDLPLYRTGDREQGPLWTVLGGLDVKWYLGSSSDPRGWALELRLDAMYTSFLDDLFTLNRTASFGALGVEAVF